MPMTQLHYSRKQKQTLEKADDWTLLHLFSVRSNHVLTIIHLIRSGHNHVSGGRDGS